jgi:hypothetical protein
MAAPALAHRRKKCANQTKWSYEVHLERALEIRGIGEVRRREGEHTGAVDQHIGCPAIALANAVDEHAQRSFVAQVAGHRRGAAADGARRVVQCLCAARHQADAPAARGERLRDGKADSS